MTRSRLRKLRLGAAVRGREAARGLQLGTAILACLSSAHAQERPDAGALEEIVVTATKRAESLQNVPMSVQALDSAKLEELHVDSFDDYAKFLPGVTYQTFGPGTAKVYMRGVSSGGTPDHAGSVPSVGMYLDEQPITTIEGPLDIHIYDVARIEALEGPQGTLYGASSEAGTIRIITNKPELDVFKAAYDVEGNHVSHGALGGLVQGFVNLPIGSTAAVRLVGWDEHDSGYINNIPGTREFPAATSVANGVTAPAWTLNNNQFVQNHYNDVDTTGARAALKIALGESWTITPVVQEQHTLSHGLFAEDTSLPDLSVQHFAPESLDDRWTQIALTVEGTISNFDIVYAAGYITRSQETHADYTDYAVAYAVSSGLGNYTLDNAGHPILSTQYEQVTDKYRMQSHELRISSPKEDRFRFVAGLFTNHQVHHAEYAYDSVGVDGSPSLGSYYSVTNFPGTFWLTNDLRSDRDSAAFTELTYDIVPRLTATAGIRYFRYDSDIEGFSGYGLNNQFTANIGEIDCAHNNYPGGAQFPGIYGSWCNNIHSGGYIYQSSTQTWVNSGLPYVNGVQTSGSGSTPKFNLSYKFDDQRLVYATYSKGFRPGGANRYGLPPYGSDYLTNYEIGWKTTWLNNRLRFNGALFLEDWKDFQFEYIGAQTIVIANAPAARIRGLETQVEWAATSQLTVDGGLSFTEAALTAPWYGFCGGVPCTQPQAPSGQMLPTTPRWKGDVTARYAFHLGSLPAFVQGSYVYQSYSWEDMRTVQRDLLGVQHPFGLADFSGGLDRGRTRVELFVTNAFDKREDLYRYSQCAETTCASPDIPGYTPHVYSVPGQPRTIGIKFGQKF